MPKKIVTCSINNSKCDFRKPNVPEIKDSVYNDGLVDTISHDNICTNKTYQRVTVNVPIAVKPFSFTGETKTTCCSDPIIKKITYACNSNKEQVCYFTISQEICVEVPVYFGAAAYAGKFRVKCHEASTDDCSDCS